MKPIALILLLALSGCVTTQELVTKDDQLILKVDPVLLEKPPELIKL